MIFLSTRKAEKDVLKMIFFTNTHERLKETTAINKVFFVDFKKIKTIKLRKILPRNFLQKRQHMISIHFQVLLIS
jgi:hypothetical protein